VHPVTIAHTHIDKHTMESPAALGKASPGGSGDLRMGGGHPGAWLPLSSFTQGAAVARGALCSGKAGEAPAHRARHEALRPMR